jgi:hypothetical protein
MEKPEVLYIEASGKRKEGKVAMLLEMPQQAAEKKFQSRSRDLYIAQ